MGLPFYIAQTLDIAEDFRKIQQINVAVEYYYNKEKGDEQDGNRNGDGDAAVEVHDKIAYENKYANRLESAKTTGGGENVC